MLKSCRYCGRIHDTKYDCGKKPKRDEKTTYIDRFRWSRAWKDKRKVILRRDRYLCQHCLSVGKYTYDGLSVHHIIPIKDSWEDRLDQDNLITLCSECHSLADKKEIKSKKLKILLVD